MLRSMRRLWSPIVSVLAWACAAGEETSSSSAGSFGNPSTPTASSSATAPTTGALTDSPTSAADPTEGDVITTFPDPATSADPSTSTPDNTTGFDTNPDGAADGSECNAGPECQTGSCYVIKLPLDDLPPGICSECAVDQDCVDRGLGIACTVDAATLGGTCTDGGLGSFCGSPMACKPQYYCEPILNNAAGVLPNACSECRDDQDCKDGKRCTPRIDLGKYSGNKFCAAPGSVPNAGLCPEFSGNTVCANGHCGVVNVVGALNVGICGECNTDADCVAPKTTCMPGSYGDVFTGSTCI